MSAASFKRCEQNFVLQHDLNSHLSSKKHHTTIRFSQKIQLNYTNIYPKYQRNVGLAKMEGIEFEKLSLNNQKISKRKTKNEVKFSIFKRGKIPNNHKK